MPQRTDKHQGNGIDVCIAQISAQMGVMMSGALISMLQNAARRFVAAKKQAELGVLELSTKQTGFLLPV